MAVLSGAGISVAAGLPTFRGPDGLWEGVRPEDLATPAAFARDPERVWRWYALRLGACLAARPTRAHHELAQLAQRTPTDVVTQNVDGLHDAAGSEDVIALHGSIRRARCTHCARVVALARPPEGVPVCAACGGALRPDVVWFGEGLDDTHVARAGAAFEAASLALVIGTSGRVWPAAGLVHRAHRAGSVVVVVDPAATALDALAAWRVRADADEGASLVVSALRAASV